MTTMSTRYDSEHKRAIDSMKKERQKELEKTQTDAASTAALLETTTLKLDKASARKNNLEREVQLLRLSWHTLYVRAAATVMLCTGGQSCCTHCTLELLQL